MTKQLFLLLLLCFMFIIPTFSQKKVLGLPEAFKSPKDWFISSEEQGKLYNNTGNKTNEAWIVFSDRDNNPVYNTPDMGSTTGQELSFRDLFYVTDEKTDWIQIATAGAVSKNLKSESINILGWVPKDKMLLWRSGLIDNRTSIHKKAFLLNRADDIEAVMARKANAKILQVNIYKDPDKKQQEDEKSIYEYYFVFKKQNNMLLLGEEVALTEYDVSSKLIGWVDQRRVEEWNTRISLEPNFTEEAFNERKTNNQFEFLAFGNSSQIPGYVQNGSKSGHFWDNDPYKMKPTSMSLTNPRRFSGNVVRFPMFGKDNYDGAEFFRSGVIGSIQVGTEQDGKFVIGSSIPETEMAKMKDVVKDLNYKTNNVNIFFVIEGTDKTYAFQKSIVSSIQNLKQNDEIGQTTNVKYGALIYRDQPEGSRIIEYKKLTPDIGSITDFIQQEDFVNRADQDDYTALYYGLKQSLKVAGFDKNETNLIILLGSCGDYSVDKDRKNDAIKNGYASLITDKSSIFRSLADLEAHFYSIQLLNDGNRYTGTAYAIQSQKMILETAKFIYNQDLNNESTREIVAKSADMQVVPPSMELPIGVTNVKLSGSKPGEITLPPKSQSLTSSQLNEALNSMISRSLNYNNALKKVFENTMNRGDKVELREIVKDGSIGVSDLSAEVARWLNKLIDKPGMKSDYVLDAMNKKLSVYSEVFIPLKADAAQYPLYSYVLFMPRTDLLRYQNLINNSLSQLNSNGSYDEKRKNLYKIYMELISDIAGQDFIKKRGKDLTRKEVLEIMQGLEKEGLKTDIDLDVRMGGIMNEKEVSNEQIDALIKRFYDIDAELDRIIKLDDRYEFCMIPETQNFYYWLRLDQVF